MRPLLILFARAPRLGTVKRRLAAGIGVRAALRFHAGTLAVLLRRLRRDRRFELRLEVTPRGARGPWRQSVATRVQGPGDLGRRMAASFATAPRRRVALMGCDIPQAGPDDAARALFLLRGAGAVFGPAKDGGYWLVAMGGCRPGAPFARVRWSTASALADTLVNFRGRQVRKLRTLSDVDDAADLARVRAETCARARPVSGRGAPAAGA